MRPTSTAGKARDEFWPRYLEVIRHYSKIRGFAVPTKESFMFEVGPQGALMTNIELYGTRVIPRVRELLA
jgi:hypothetical protein